MEKSHRDRELKMREEEYAQLKSHYESADIRIAARDEENKQVREELKSVYEELTRVKGS